jgi:addiction module RelE/StbE family toxin
MEILRKKSFLKNYIKLPEKIQDRTDAAILIFVDNPHDASLRNHPLYHEYIWCRSIDVTGDYRIIFREISEDMYELVELIRVGTHSQLYW